MRSSGSMAVCGADVLRGGSEMDDCTRGDFSGRQRWD